MSNNLLSIMTFNAANEFTAPADLIALIERSGAGIVGLQELNESNAAALEVALRQPLPHRILFGEYIHGKGILSRFPILWHEQFPLASRRWALEARLDMDGQETAVFVAHPPPPDYRSGEVLSRVGIADVTILLGRVRPELPTLLLGDFNFIRPTRGYRMLEEAGLVDTFRAAGRGRGLTYPTRHQTRPIRLPRMIRIDFIWASKHFQPVRSWVGPNVGSDHLPLFSALVPHSSSSSHIAS